MARLRRTLGIDRVGIERMATVGDVQGWLRKFAVLLEDNYRLQLDAFLGSTAAETPNWFVREATAADVTAGQARTVGNLLIEHKTNGTKHEFEG